MSKQVALVLDEKVTETIESATKDMPIWIIETRGNAAFIAHSRQESCNVITAFSTRAGESKPDLAERIVYTLDEHHNEHSQDNPYDTLLVFGLALKEAKQYAFRDLGFSEFEETDYGFIARKLK